MATKINKQVGIAISDAHIPFEDKSVCEQVVECIRDHRPGAVHLLGDMGDFYEVSRFSKDPLRKETLQDDLDFLLEFLEKVRDAAPGARIIYTEGNHENRLITFLRTQAPSLCALRCLELPKLLKFGKLRIHYRTERQPYRIGSLLFTHGQLIRRWSAYSARAHFEKYGCCVIHGHTHRLGAFYHRDMDNTFGAWENGCICSLNPEFVMVPDWQHGWSVIWTRGEYFHVDQVPVIKGKYIYHGKIYGKARLSSTALFVVEDLTP